MELHNKNIIIAFDGPDNVGKGTQIALLRKWLSSIPFVLLNLDRPAGETDSEKIMYGLSACKNILKANMSLWKSNIPQIVDRMHYTEYAYSILRGGHSVETILEMEGNFLDLKESFFTIIFIDEIENIAKRDDGKSNYNVDNHDEVRTITNRFSEIAEHSLFDNIVINIHKKNIPTVQEEVKSAILNKFPNLLN